MKRQKKEKRHGEKRENKNDEREQLRKSKNKESKHKNKADQFVFRGFFFLNRNKEIKTKRNKIFARKRPKKGKLKIMKKLSKSRKQWFFPRVIFLTRINDIF